MLKSSFNPEMLSLGITFINFVIGTRGDRGRDGQMLWSVLNFNIITSFLGLKRIYL